MMVDSICAVCLTSSLERHVHHSFCTESITRRSLSGASLAQMQLERANPQSNSGSAGVFLPRHHQPLGAGKDAALQRPTRISFVSRLDGAG